MQQSVEEGHPASGALDDSDLHTDLSLSEIRAKKQALVESSWVRGTKNEPDTDSLRSLRVCVERCRGSVCFSACVARDPETPLTELHLMQPVLGLLLAFGLALLLLTATLVALPSLLKGDELRMLELLSAGVALAAGVGCTYVCLIARGVPSHEQLNKKQKMHLDHLEKERRQLQNSAADAEQLEGMTHRSVKDRRDERDKLKKLNEELETELKKRRVFQFKAHLLRYLSRGEGRSCQKRLTELFDESEQMEPGGRLEHFAARREKMRPDGLLSLKELRHIRSIVQLTERNNSAYVFLGEVLDALCKDFKLLEDADLLEDARVFPMPYADVVSRVCKKAQKDFAVEYEKFSLSYLAESLSSSVQQQQHQKQQTPVSPPSSSPPPSPPFSPLAMVSSLMPSLPLSPAGAAVGAGAIVAIVETKKPWLFRHAWTAGAAGSGLAAGVLALAVATGEGAQFVSVFSSALATVCSLLGWWVCSNKKNDLVMQCALKRFKDELKELDAAEHRLRGALETMLACGTNMTKLQEEIDVEISKQEDQLNKMRDHSERAGRGTRRGVLNTVLVQLADVNINLEMGPAERRRLLYLLSNMSGREPVKLKEFYTALELVAPRVASDDVNGDNGKRGNNHDSCDNNGKSARGKSGRSHVGVLNVLKVLEADNERKFKTWEVLNKLDKLGAFEMLLGHDVPEGSQLEARKDSEEVEE